MLPEAVVYTDGSCSPKTKRGGWAAIVLLPNLFVELCGFAEDTTNNRMEMMAAIHGLKELKEPHLVHLVSDSAYLLNAIHQKWYNRWFADEAFFGDAFAKAQGRPVPRPNMDLWRVMASLDEFHDIQTVKVKGHSGDWLNTHVDKLAVRAGKANIEYRRELPDGIPPAGEPKTLPEFAMAGSGVLVSEEKVNGNTHP